VRMIAILNGAETSESAVWPLYFIKKSKSPILRGSFFSRK
jgi:hypothetical protein